MSDGHELLLGPGGLTGFTVHTDREPNAGTRRLMDWLGVKVDVVTTPFDSRDCELPGCPREADAGSSFCSQHRESDGPVRWPRAQLIEAIAPLKAAGMTRPEIAAELGIGLSALHNAMNDPDGEKQRARREGYVGECVDCGAETKSDGTSSPSPRCGPCSIEANRHWTREAAIEVIQNFARIHGRAPLASEWLRNVLQPNMEVGTVQRLFGSWANGIEAAGFPRPKRGHKVLERGKGVGNMARVYYVLHKNGDDAFYAVTVEAFSPEQAIEKVADSEGEWVAVLDRYWVTANVEEQTKLAVVKA